MRRERGLNYVMLALVYLPLTGPQWRAHCPAALSGMVGGPCVVASPGLLPDPCEGRLPVSTASGEAPAPEASPALTSTAVSTPGPEREATSRLLQNLKVRDLKIFILHNFLIQPLPLFLTYA